MLMRHQGLRQGTGALPAVHPPAAVSVQGLEAGDERFDTSVVLFLATWYGVDSKIRNREQAEHAAGRGA